MSEVYYEFTKESLEALVKRADHIVLIKAGDPAKEVVKQVVFPRKTHFDKQSETKYTEFVEIYNLKAVLKSNKIKEGIIKVWVQPEYGEASTKWSHETGDTESPIVRKYKPENRNQKGDERILFLLSDSEHLDRTIFIGAEGLKTEEKIRKILSAPPPSGCGN